MSVNGRTEFRIGVDIGGTFTDCVVVDRQGVRTISKALTTHGSLAEGVITAVRRNAEDRGIDVAELLARTRAFVHGNTVATNAILTRTGARTGLITTRGHEDTLIIGKVYSKRAGLSEREIARLPLLKKPEPIVPRELIRGVAERIDVDGDVIVAMRDDEVKQAALDLLGQGVEAIAVAFLWSFVNPAHELRAKAILNEIAPGAYKSFSHELAPVLGEYERTVTTMLNSYVGPRVSGYLDALQRELAGLGLAHPVLVMQASGGLTTIDDAKRRPIFTLDSGPAGGILGCWQLGEIYREEDIICTDVGGTSFDVGLISNGSIPLDPQPVVAQYVMRIPKLAVQSIGAGGGSIGWVDQGGVLRVGPQSAGSVPGPACYGRGGTLPTVTDADLVLGYLDAGSFLGGKMRLDRDKALVALGQLGKSLGMDAEEVAVGMFRIINAQMADLIRKSTIEQGHDPRDCVLVAYGGAGPTHATFYGRDTGVKSILVPAASTVFSAEGMLTCDIVHTAEASFRMTSPPKAGDFEAVKLAFNALDAEITKQFKDEGANPANVTLTRFLGIRYRQQVHTVEVAVPDTTLTPDAWDELVQQFTQRYAQLYGRAAVLADAGVETSSLRVVGRLPIEKFDLRPQSLSDANPAAALHGERPVYFEGVGHVATRVYSGHLLKPANVIAGPAIIQRMGDSVVVPAGYRLEVDPYLTLVIRRNAAAQHTVSNNAMAAVQ